MSEAVTKEYLDANMPRYVREAILDGAGTAVRDIVASELEPVKVTQAKHQQILLGPQDGTAIDAVQPGLVPLVREINETVSEWRSVLRALKYLLPMIALQAGGELGQRLIEFFTQ